MKLSMDIGYWIGLDLDLWIWSLNCAKSELGRSMGVLVVVKLPKENEQLMLGNTFE